MDEKDLEGYTMGQRYDTEIFNGEVICRKKELGFWFPWHLHDIVVNKLNEASKAKDRKIEELTAKLGRIEDFAIEIFDLDTSDD